MSKQFCLGDQTWNLEGKVGDWPPEVQAWFREHWSPPRDQRLCQFGDWPCQRLDAQHLCGGLPHRQVKQRRYPYWLVKGMRTEVLPILPPQQLSFIDNPSRLWRMIESGLLVPHRQWWVGVYQCLQGADWAVTLEQCLGAPRVEVYKVDRPSRRRVIVTPEPFCGGY